MTVEGHLSYYISKGDLQINNFVDTSKQQAIKQAAELFGAEPLRTLKENLPEEITYGEIRMVLASMSIEER
jgi:ATP-dependent DNA helicase RecQ